MVQNSNELRKLILDVQSALIEELPEIIDIELSNLPVYDGLGYKIRLSAPIPGRAHPNHTHLIIEVKTFLSGTFKPSSPFYHLKHKKGRSLQKLEMKQQHNRLSDTADIAALVKFTKANIYLIGVRA